MSIRQADEVAARLESAKLPWNRLWHAGPVSTSGEPVTLPAGMRLTILSPGPEQLARLGRDWEEYRLKSASPDTPPNEVSDEEGPGKSDVATETVQPIFISYVRADVAWAMVVRKAVEEAGGPAVILRDDVMAPGDDGEQRLREALDEAAVVLLLLSPHALASNVFMNVELPVIMRAVDQGRLPIGWLLIEPCAWQNTPLSRRTSVVDVARPLATLGERELQAELSTAISRLIALAQGGSRVAAARRARNRGPIDVEALASASFVADRAVANNASIAFLAEHDGRSLLVGGDASADVLAASIGRVLASRGHKRLRVDAFVVPHNGSARNLHRGLLELLDCDRYLIASDGASFGHPDRETIARILAYGRATAGRPLTLVFNYRSRVNDVWASPELQSRYHYRAVYPDGDGGGITVQLS